MLIIMKTSTGLVPLLVQFQNYTKKIIDTGILTALLVTSDFAGYL